MTVIYLKSWLDAYGTNFSLLKIVEYTFLYQATLMTIPIFNQLYLVKKFYLQKAYWKYSTILTLALIASGFVFMWIDDLYLNKNDFPWMYTFAHWSSRLPFQIMFVFVGNWFELSRELQRQQELEIRREKSKAETELKLLVSQINPHFLFNALNNINSLIHLEKKEASASLVKLSELLKYVIKEGSEKTVSIEKEAEHLRNYYAISIMKERWQNKIHIDIMLENQSLKVPPLLFINFVENSVKHCNLDEENSFIQLDLRADQKGVYFKLINTFSPSLLKDKAGGIGIENVKSRLAILYPNKHSLNIKKKENEFLVELELLSDD